MRLPMTPTATPPLAAPNGLSMPPRTAPIVYLDPNMMGGVLLYAFAGARPQPIASIHPTRMPTSRLDTGFCAAARMARPSGVKRKNA